MKYRKKQLLSLLLSTAILIGNSSVSAAGFSSGANETVPFSEDTSSENDISLADPEDSFSASDQTAQEDIFIEDPEITEAPEYTEPEGNAGLLDGSQNVEDFSSGEMEEELFSSGDTINNTEDADYILGRPMTEEEIQEQLDLMENMPAFSPAEDPDSDLSISKYGLLPSYYDSRQSGIISSVKNQNPFNICWAFSLASNFETSLLKQGLGTWDLSEEHLAYFFANRVNDPLGNTPDDRIVHLGKNYHDSGNGMVASFFLSTWSGMVSEGKAPLPTDSTHTLDLSRPLDPAIAYNTDVYLKDAVFSAYSQQRMKQLVSEYGSVSAMILMDNAGVYYRPETAAACCPTAGKVNHAVTIVGWDDSYSKSNFPAASMVQKDGAWIVKNSYGSSWGKNGYFYLSYEDASISNLVCNTAITSPQYPNNYFYDGAASGTTSYTVKAGSSIANVFTVSAGQGNAEELGEIVLSSKQDFTTYRIQIYTDLSDPQNPASGTPAFRTPIEYTQPIAGIHTLKLDNPVKLVQGSKYSVVLTFPYETKYYVEANTSSASGSWFRSIAGLEPGQSFLSSTGTRWTDCAASKSNFCFCIKAHTRTLEAPAVITPRPTTAPRPTSTPRPTAAPRPTSTPVPRTYQVVYKANTSLPTGSMPSDKTRYTSGQSIKIKSAPYCTSRFFLGWNTRADGTGATYLPGKTLTIKGNITLYAKWGSKCIPSTKLIYQVTGKQTVACCGTTNPNIKKVVIPSSIRYMGITYRVTSVWTNAFRGKNKLTNVVIGNNVSVVGSRAFYNCRSLNRITIGTGLKQIGTYSFGRVKRKCIIKITSTQLSKVSAKIDYGSQKMTIRVPRKKLNQYRKLFSARSRTVTVKSY